MRPGRLWQHSECELDRQPKFRDQLESFHDGPRNHELFEHERLARRSHELFELEHGRHGSKHEQQREPVDRFDQLDRLELDDEHGGSAFRRRGEHAPGRFGERFRGRRHGGLSGGSDLLRRIRRQHDARFELDRPQYGGRGQCARRGDDQGAYRHELRAHQLRERGKRVQLHQ